MHEINLAKRPPEHENHQKNDPKNNKHIQATMRKPKTYLPFIVPVRAKIPGNLSPIKKEKTPAKASNMLIQPNPKS